MFTGIVTHVGEILSVEGGAEGRRLFVRTGFAPGSVDIGASVSCDGCCLTVEAIDGDVLQFSATPETLGKTILGGWEEGMKINLERSLRMGDELGGHLISGHVDGLAVLESVTLEGNGFRLKICAPEELARYIAPKGSVALNGVSLTVNEVDGSVFGVFIIPHTWDVTAFSSLNSGDSMNIEVDMMARYAARVLGRED